MDLGFRAIHDVVHPTAVYSRPDDAEYDDHLRRENQHDDDTDDCDDHEDGHSGDGGWATSQLNPQNRIDSLSPLSHPLWRIDGSAGLGTQYYAVPLFVAERAPMRIDVFIHEGASYSPVLRGLLDLDTAFHVKDAGRLRHLGITQHLLRILQWHTTHAKGALHPDVVEDLYRRGPFGTRIIVENLGCHMHESKIVVSRNYPLESDLMAYRDLLSIWGLADAKQGGPGGGPGEAGRVLPREVDVQDVRLVQQLHDSICEVYITDGGGGGGGGGEDGEQRGELVVLKSLTSSIKYMYHELRALLKDIPPHAHVIGRPQHVVTKACLFGGKRGVIGFTIPYHRAGSLRDQLPLLRAHGQLALADQLRWAVQLSGAMCHIWHEGRSFYPDLRLDNIVLNATAPGGDVVVVDFEQRGVWCGFAAPEVDLVENLRILARDDPEAAMAVPDDDITEGYRQALGACWAAADPAYRQEAGERWARALHQLEEETRYRNPAQGYNTSWICLTRREQEAAMVYMLGRVLWCIFEGQSAPHRGAVWQSYVREPDGAEFPHFARTPPEVQELLVRCIGDSGVAAQQDRFVRHASKLYMRVDAADAADGVVTADAAGDLLVADHLGARARAFWQARLAEGAAWLEARNARLHKAYADGADRSETQGSAYGRPTLRQVAQRLEEIGRQL